MASYFNDLDSISHNLTIATCAVLIACVLAVPFFGFLPLIVALGSLLSVAVMAKMLRGD